MAIKNKKILYVTYLGLLEPIPKSQVIPYLIALAKQNHIFVLSFEKKNILKEKSKEVIHLKRQLHEAGIQWYRLRYHRFPKIVSSFYDIFVGFCFSYYIMLKHRITIFHARSNIPIAIAYLLKKISHIKILYDRRGVMGDEHVENSGWKKNGLLHKMAMYFERKVLVESNAIVVLTHRMNEIFKNQIPLQNKIISTIPCCTDLTLFKREISFKNMDEHILSELKDKFIFVYSGTLGTYNLFPEMISFFRVAKQMIANAHLLLLTSQIPSVDSDLKKNITVTHTEPIGVPQFLSLSHVGLIFRQHSSTAVAASPTKMAEYLACGLPIISLSHIGDAENIIKRYHVGALLESYNSFQYDAAIKVILDLFKNEEELRLRCRQTAEHYFPLSLGVDRYNDIYKQLSV